MFEGMDTDVSILRFNRVVLILHLSPVRCSSRYCNVPLLVTTSLIENIPVQIIFPTGSDSRLLLDLLILIFL